MQLRIFTTLTLPELLINFILFRRSSSIVPLLEILIMLLNFSLALYILCGRFKLVGDFW